MEIQRFLSEAMRLISRKRAFDVASLFDGSSGSGSSACVRGVETLLQPLLQLDGKVVVAFLAHRLQIKLVELGFLRHFGVTNGAGKVVDTPRFIQSRENVARDNRITDETHVPEQLMIVRFAVGKSLLLVVSGAEEGLFAFGADKVLDMPLLPQRVHYSVLDRSTARAANRNTHLVMTS